MKKSQPVLPYVIPLLLLFFSILTYSHLNWKEDLFLSVLMSLYAVDLLFRRTLRGLNDYLLPFLLIFLLSQFYIHSFQPGNAQWWFGSIPGWLTFLTALTGFVSLSSYLKMRSRHPLSQPIHPFFPHLIRQVAPGVICVSLAMLFLFLLNLDEISPQKKLVPDYSISMVVALGFVLFYLLHFSLQNGPLNVRHFAICFKATSFAILIFLVGMGAVKIYWACEQYHRAAQIKSEEKLWHDLLKLNQVPRIKKIEARAFIELGNIHRERGDLKNASIYYKKYLMVRPFDFKANLALAKIAHEQKQWRGACEQYRRAVYLNPSEKELYIPLVQCCARGGRVGEAMEFIGRLRENHPLPKEKIE